MTRLRTLTIAGLILLAFATVGCQRTATEEPSPLGPSTFVLTFALHAEPSLLLASAERQTSVISATVMENNRPAVGRTVVFSITSGPGEFSDYKIRTQAKTDFNGVAQIIFVGPTRFEIPDDATTTILAQLVTGTPEVIAKTVDLTILFMK
jgi:hypothetical protein